MMRYILILFLLYTSSVSSSVSCYAADIDISSEELTIDLPSSLGVFSGHVHVSDGRNLKMDADKVVISYDGSEISTIHASGNILVSGKDERITSNTAVYNFEKGMLELSGNINVSLLSNNKKVLLSTESIQYNVKTGKSDIYSSNERVRIKVEE